MGDMLEKVLKTLAVSESELPSPSPHAKSSISSPTPSGGSSNESHLPNHDDDGHE